MNEMVRYQVHENIAVVTIDDGKANAVSFKFVEGVNAALDQAVEDKAVVILTGRPGKFSAGFELSVVTKGGEAAVKLVRAGGELAVRLLGFPAPVIVACNGHCMASGALLLLSTDYRIGVQGNYKIGTNEVAIGMPLPCFGVELARFRLSPIHFSRAMANAEIYTPQGAVEAGFLDVVVPEERLMETAMESAQALAKLDMAAHYETKLRVRKEAIGIVDKAIEKEFGL